jgi:hypothetical protein
LTHQCTGNKPIVTIGAAEEPDTHKESLPVVEMPHRLALAEPILLLLRCVPT